MGKSSSNNSKQLPKTLTGDPVYDAILRHAGIRASDYALALETLRSGMRATIGKGAKGKHAPPDWPTRLRAAERFAAFAGLEVNRPRVIIPIVPDEGTRERYLAEVPESVLAEALRSADGKGKPAPADGS